jgi:iron complex transport system substrate-binding protein
MKKYLSALFIMFCSILFSGEALSRTVIDETGHKFNFAYYPKRIVSTIPSNTEILFGLGLKDRIVGVTNQCNYPAETKSVEKVGSVNLSLEKIVSLKPDLILMLEDAQKVQIERLRALGLPVFVINPHSVYGLMKSIKLVGKVTGSDDAAHKMVASINDRIQKISSKYRSYRNLKVLVVIWVEPLITAGKGTYIDDLIRYAGGINIGSKVHGAYPIMNFETVLSEKPDFIIIAGKSNAEMTFIKNDKKWGLLDAVNKRNILLIDSDVITRPGPRLVDALDIIVSFIHKREADEE